MNRLHEIDSEKSGKKNSLILAVDIEINSILEAFFSEDKTFMVFEKTR